MSHINSDLSEHLLSILEDECSIERGIARPLLPHFDNRIIIVDEQNLPTQERSMERFFSYNSRREQGRAERFLAPFPSNCKFAIGRNVERFNRET